MPLIDENRRLHQLPRASDFVVQFHPVDFLAGVRRHTVSTAETTDCAHTYHHAFGLQQKGHSTGVVGCPEGRKCAPAIQSLRSLARHPFCLNIYQKCVAKGKRPWRESKTCPHPRATFTLATKATRQHCYITYKCAHTITHPGPFSSNGSSTLTRPSVGRS